MDTSSRFRDLRYQYLAVCIVIAVTMSCGCKPERSTDNDPPAMEAQHAGADDGESGGSTAQTDQAPPAPGELRITSSNIEDGIVGAYGSPTGTVRFTAELDPTTNTASATFSTIDGALELEARIASTTSGTVTWQGRELSGYGALTPAQEGALRQLGDGELGRALAMIPMELGCLIEDNPETLEATAMQRAALVMPWQMLIKYDRSYPNVFELHRDSTCRYLPPLDEEGVPIRTGGLRDLNPPGLRLAVGDEVPYVYGYFPFDEHGAAEDKNGEQKTCGGDKAPCGGADICNACCRGACGPDCDHRGCSETKHFVCEKDAQGYNTGNAVFVMRSLECGSAQGCLDHDACYDLCHIVKGCGTWGAAACRRGCDTLCIDEHGYSNCIGWSRGGGPQDSTVSFCEEINETVPSPEDCPPNNDGGSSQGDPHILTLDGLAYDFQAVGEFVLVEWGDDESPLSVQVRQAPVPGSPCRDVSLNTAVAALRGESRVAVYAHREPPLLIDGVPVVLEVGDSRELDDGGAVVRSGARTWTLVWPNGVRLDVTLRFGWLDLDMSFPANWTGETRGLLGTLNGNSDDDLTARDGRVLATPVGLVELYADFGESFRIAETESVFDYEEGETWASFQDSDFPHGLGRVDGLPVELRTGAEEVCRSAGISDESLLAACIIDVACTGDNTAAQPLARTDPPVTPLEVVLPAYAGPPEVSEVFPEAAVSGGSFYLSGANFATTSGAVDFTRVAVAAGEQQIILGVTGTDDRVTVSVPVDMHERIEGPATLSVRTPAGEASYGTPIFFSAAPLFGDTVREPGQGLQGTIYSLRSGTRLLPDFTDACADAAVVSDEQTPCPYSSVVVPNLDLPPRHFTEGFPGVGAALHSWFAISFTGFVSIETEGTHAFRICSDDGSRLRIGELIIDNDGIHPNYCIDGTVDLLAGSHGITVEYFQGPPAQIALQLYWTRPGTETREIIPPSALHLFE